MFLWPLQGFGTHRYCGLQASSSGGLTYPPCLSLLTPLAILAWCDNWTQPTSITCKGLRQLSYHHPSNYPQYSLGRHRQWTSFTSASAMGWFTSWWHILGRLGFIKGGISHCKQGDFEGAESDGPINMHEAQHRRSERKVTPLQCFRNYV